MSVMKLTDKEVVDLIKASGLNDTDNYFTLGEMPRRDGIETFARGFHGRILVLTPSKTFIRPTEKVIYAFIGAASDEEFPDLLKRMEVSEILLPFFECADIREYGYRASYASLAEARASTAQRFHITGFSLFTPEDRDVFDVLSDGKALYTAFSKNRTFNAVDAGSEKSKYHYTAAECEKSPFKKTAVLFSTRRQAEEFSLFMYKRRTPFALFHGGLDERKRADALMRFAVGETNLLLATKSAIASYPVITADRAIYCGLPYGRPHALRSSCLSKDGSMNVIYSVDDVILTRKLISSFASELGIDDPGYVIKRNEAFDAFLDELNN